MTLGLAREVTEVVADRGCCGSLPRRPRIYRPVTRWNMSRIIEKIPLPGCPGDHNTVVETKLGPVTISQWASMTDAETIEAAETCAKYIYPCQS